MYKRQVRDLADDDDDDAGLEAEDDDEDGVEEERVDRRFNGAEARGMVPSIECSDGLLSTFNFSNKEQRPKNGIEST